MKLFSFNPNAPGPSSYFVMAETEQEARAAVIASLTSVPDVFRDDREQFEFGTYEVTEVGPGEVLQHSNC